MGVRTKQFGPHAWIVFETIARIYDESKSDPSSPMSYLVREFLVLIGFVLPCVYCRVSYRTFLKQLGPEVDSLRLPVKRIVYDLHCCVNAKLRNQQLEKCVSCDEKNRVRRSTRDPSFMAVLKKRFLKDTDPRFWTSLFMFCGYALCDTCEDNVFVPRFMEVIGTLLEMLGSTEWVRASGRVFREKSKEEFSRYSELETDPVSSRLDSMGRIVRLTMRHVDAKVASRIHADVKTCERDIVGCNKRSLKQSS